MTPLKCISSPRASKPTSLELWGVGALRCDPAMRDQQRARPRNSWQHHRDNSYLGGAVVPGAIITAINDGTQASRSATTDDNGDYAIPLLSPGTYTVRAEKPGFAAAVAAKIVVQVSQSTRVDLRIRLGAVGQTVEVTAAAPLVETANATVGQVIGTQPVQDLPLNGRDFSSEQFRTPGAVTQNGNTARLAQTGSYAGGNQPVIAGQRLDASTITLDGFLDARPYDNTPAVRPSIDALQEFKIDASNLSAEKGRNPVLVENSNQIWHECPAWGRLGLFKKQCP